MNRSMYVSDAYILYYNVCVYVNMFYLKDILASFRVYGSCMYVCMYCMYVCIRMYCMRVCTYVCTTLGDIGQMSQGLCTVCMYVYMYVCVYVCMYGYFHLGI
jgi:hypothetical protein